MRILTTSGLNLTYQGRNEMAQASLSHAECNAIHILREMANDATRKQVKREIFSRAKVAFGIPATHKLVVETDVQNSTAGILRNKATRETYELAPATGKWIHANGANSAKRWYLVKADDVAQALRDALDSMNPDDITASTVKPTAPASATFTDNGDNIVVMNDGNAWIELDADAYEAEAVTPSHDEEEDDHPY
jgi:hypothetical protein